MPQNEAALPWEVGWGLEGCVWMLSIRKNQHLMLQGQNTWDLSAVSENYFRWPCSTQPGNARTPALWWHFLLQSQAAPVFWLHGRCIFLSNKTQKCVSSLSTYWDAALQCLDLVMFRSSFIKLYWSLVTNWQGSRMICKTWTHLG